MWYITRHMATTYGLTNGSPGVDQVSVELAYARRVGMLVSAAVVLLVGVLVLTTTNAFVANAGVPRALAVLIVAFVLLSLLGVDHAAATTLVMSLQPDMLPAFRHYSGQRNRPFRIADSVFLQLYRFHKFSPESQTADLQARERAGLAGAFISLHTFAAPVAVLSFAGCLAARRGLVVSLEGALVGLVVAIFWGVMLSMIVYALAGALARRRLARGPR